MHHQRELNNVLVRAILFAANNERRGWRRSRESVLMRLRSIAFVSGWNGNLRWLRGSGNKVARNSDLSTEPFSYKRHFTFCHLRYKKAISWDAGYSFLLSILDHGDFSGVLQVALSFVRYITHIYVPWEGMDNRAEYVGWDNWIELSQGRYLNISMWVFV